MAQLVNNALAAGTVDGVAVSAPSQVVVELGSIYMNKTADPMVWTTGALTYNIEILNNEDPTSEPPGLPIDNLVFTDTIDPAIAELIEETLTATIDGTQVDPLNYTYTPATGALEISFGSVNPQSRVEISFQVSRV